jgi:prepilin-type N-terminal cleavage/methylation domain-containing protein
MASPRSIAAASSLGRRRAFTLIEVLVAIVIAGVTITAIYTIFRRQSKQLAFDQLQAEMNQSMRFATDMVTRSIRLAGYGTGGYVTGVMGPTNPGIGSEGLLLPAVVAWDGNGPNGTDAITVVHADPSMMMDTDSTSVPPCNTTSVRVRPGMLDHSQKLQQLNAGDLLICFDYADIRGVETYLWSITGSPDLGSGDIPITDNSALSDYAAVCPSGENLSPVLTCSRAVVNTFYVDDVDDGIGPGSPAHPTLMLDMNMSWPSDDDVPLVDNIEDFQIEYCLADPTSDTANCADATSWVDGSAVNVNQAHLVWMARVMMTVRSSREDQGGAYRNQRQGLSNRSGGSGEDSYYRQYLTTEVTLRNIRYQAVL